MPATIEQVYETVKRVETQVKEITKGLYGSLSKPGSGFIHESNRCHAGHNERIKDLENDKKGRTWLKRTFWGAIITAFAASLLAIVKTLT